MNYQTPPGLGGVNKDDTSISTCKTFSRPGALRAWKGSRERLCLVAPLDLRIQKEEKLLTFFYRCAFIFIS